MSFFLDPNLFYWSRTIDQTVWCWWLFLISHFHFSFLSFLSFWPFFLHIDFNFVISTNFFLFKRFCFTWTTQVLFEYSSTPKAFQPERLIAAFFWYHHNNIHITCAGLPLCRERFSGEVELLLSRPGPRPGFRSQRSPPPLLCVRTRSCAIGSFCNRVYSSTLVVTRTDYSSDIRVLL